MKISYEIEGYPWGNNNDFIPGFSNKASFLSLWFDCTSTEFDLISVLWPGHDFLEQLVNFLLT